MERMHNVILSRGAVYLAWTIVGMVLVSGVLASEARARPDESEWHLQVANMRDLYALDVTLTFDAAAIEVVDADEGRAGVQIVPGPLFDGRPYFVVYNRVTVDAETDIGTVEFVITLLNPAEPIRGDGTVATIRYRQLDASTAVEPPFVIEDARLASRSGNWLLIVWEGNTIRQVFGLYLPLILRNDGVGVTGARRPLGVAGGLSDGYRMR